MRHARLCEPLVGAHHPLIAQERVELKRRRKGGRIAHRTVRIRNLPIHARVVHAIDDRLSVLARTVGIFEQVRVVRDQVG